MLIRYNDLPNTLTSKLEYTGHHYPYFKISLRKFKRYLNEHASSYEIDNSVENSTIELSLKLNWDYSEFTNLTTEDLFLLFITIENNPLAPE